MSRCGGASDMLRDIYFSAGGVGTFFIAIGMFLSFIGWWMAITATVTREALGTSTKALVVLVVSLLPPVGILVSAFYIRKDGRQVSRAMKTVPDGQKRVERLMKLPMGQQAIKAA